MVFRYWLDLLKVARLMRIVNIITYKTTMLFEGSFIIVRILIHFWFAFYDAVKNESIKSHLKNVVVDGRCYMYVYKYK